ncbi:hypothetical protein AMELA_G00227520 [Ameiurus melas]|uniref:Uncharacterized protein n=1 Tax=Ameiurus melas TaxID=219545 RepID=A0A7J6A2Q0_AMEME|nr:hypothetical protein AMELA_G00227520 [Ameiurus melas]
MLRLLPIYVDDDESDDDGVRLSVEETEPERIQSSVRPFYSDYDTYDLRDSYDEAEEISQRDVILQLSVREEERGHLLARSLDESSEVNNYTGV